MLRGNHISPGNSLAYLAFQATSSHTILWYIWLTIPGNNRLKHGIEVDPLQMTETASDTFSTHQRGTAWYM